MRRLVLVVAVIALAGCANAAPSLTAAPPTPTGPRASAGSTTPAASLPPSVAPSAAASLAPSVPASATACTVSPFEGALSSNQLLSVHVAGGPVSDRVTFRFGPRANQPTTPRGHLREIRPPILEGASGNEIRVDGQRFLEVRFDGMYLFDEAGNPAFSGEREIHPDLSAIREVVATEEFEGVFTWVVGFDGGGCASLSGDPATRTVILDVTHGLG